jgi:hypothetical protein
MRSIVLMGSVALLLGGLAPGLAWAQGCAGQREADKVLASAQPLTAPVGQRFVVSAQWKDQPTTIVGETRITDALYQDLEKLGKNGAVLAKRIPYDQPSGGWDVESSVTQGISDMVEIAPGAIASDPTYHRNGSVFSVDRFTYATPQVVSVNELKSPTDRYCVVQFTYHAAYTPLLAVLADAPDTARRKGRLLARIDPYAPGWVILAYDLAPQGHDYTTTKVTDAATTLALLR